MGHNTPSPQLAANFLTLRGRQQIEAAQEQVLPASKLGGAIAYTLGLWERLRRQRAGRRSYY